jgi:16S rRNA (adenine1518-N6/adenine1519-N6)-dimethyltransferase
MNQNESLIQIVDERDQVIGAIPKEEALKQSKIHRISRVMAEDPEGRILLQKRSLLVPHPGVWDSSAAGHVDENETYEQAAKRETFEEIGVKDLPLEPIDTFYSEYDYQGIKVKRFTRVYKAKLNYMPKNFDTGEVTELRWFSLEEIKKMIQENPELFIPNLIQTIKSYY